MRRSLPVLLGLAAVLVIALLIGGGFLSLPKIGSDDSLARGEDHFAPAPRVNPEPLEVDYTDEQPREKKDEDDKKDRERKKKGEKDGRKKDADRKRKGGGSGDGGKTRGSGAANPSKPPAGTDGGDGDGGNPRNDGRRRPKPDNDNNNNEEPKPDKDPKPQDPDPVTVTDLRGDTEGEGSAPAHIDLEEVRLTATGNVFVAELTFAGNVPARTPNDGTALLASLEVNRDGKKVSVYAEADDEGWRAHTSRSSDFPGSLEIDGRTMRFTVARSFFGEEFSWYAHSSWTKSTTTNTHYAFDFAPDDQNGRFPSGGTT